jgi:hypothetical protein
MLDTSHTQGAGLTTMVNHATPRLMAVASHGDTESEMQLLWRLCAALAELPVAPLVVLDGTATESAANPGLADMLRSGARASGSAVDGSAWCIIPSLAGLNQLSYDPTNTPPLNRLAKLLRNQGVVIVYAKAEILGSLLAGSGVEPLLAVSTQHASRITAYQSLKRMLLNAELRPTIAAMVRGPMRDALAAGHMLSSSLQTCAKQFLGYQLNALTLPTDTDIPSPDMRQLATRLFERAQPLQSHAWLATGSS